MTKIINFILKIAGISSVFYCLITILPLIAFVLYDGSAASVKRIQSYENDECVFNQLKSKNENNETIMNYHIRFLNASCNREDVSKQQINELKGND